jgi:predicted dehydrogenase
MTDQGSAVSRRGFMSLTGKGLVTASIAGAAPAIVPASVLGATSPANRINVGAIGTGRISREHDMPETLKLERARIVAVCDLDRRRLEDGRTFVNSHYAKATGRSYDGVRMYDDYRELLANPDIDAVLISTPDHQHALLAIHAVEAGKDVYLQKPASLTIAEGRALSNAVHRTGRILQIGSQNRSLPQFRYACELVRNGRIGQLKTVEVGLAADPAGEEEPEMPVPAHFNYDAWLGSTPYVYYTEKRVHPQVGYARPVWLRCEQFGAGMITGWGAHHIDMAHWGMNTEHTGPVEIWGTAEFPTRGLWDVHGPFRTESLYANGVHLIASDSLPTGVKFTGTEGWIYVNRVSQVTGSDPAANLSNPKALDASDRRIITSVIGPDEVHLIESDDHHGNWLDAIRTRQLPLAPVEVGHRSCSACLLHHMAMRAGRRLYWDPLKERFRNDDEANSWLSRPQRWPYGLET